MLPLRLPQQLLQRMLPPLPRKLRLRLQERRERVALNDDELRARHRSGRGGAGTAIQQSDLTERVAGFQHGTAGLDTGSVVTVVKHWVGYGAAKDGFDSHSYYGRFAVFPGNNLDYHVRPFLGALRRRLPA